MTRMRAVFLARMQEESVDQDRQDKAGNGGKRRLWPWLLLGVVTVLAIYAYVTTIQMIEDLTQLWSDLVQLFWWIMPDIPAS
ncbi:MULTISPECIES: hypothetical protein [Agrobacterium tumefaciens complex]|jgi:hypothetical protein|uniref:Uncharacterized protein n=2 Tax=Agrobacterium tumefaciens complex TaxID=1183400 RepID=A0A822UXS6_AGRTU|nr:MULTISPECIES: hypothetical protein [Agrobacterium tumefaciens complex]AYM05534.1 hypothetical protein At1D1460_12920 [Agrobacterium tumefaciens]EHH02847.1 hypothetical protein ATCR1_23181 [Agrobacterium tumefaciens CCNWGS0286]EPR20595.1 hypothetical protein L902_29325 [Agrobacterium radiobacter DSM 30147]KWT80734.1 hypothetical protein ASH09_05745 [Agrobacterium radiobacter]KWT85849.1 hypothetical protein ASB65_24365 [Agrobacterium tumefaciens str. B6]